MQILIVTMQLFRLTFQRIQVVISRKVAIVYEIIVFISVYFTAQTTALTKINSGWGDGGGELRKMRGKGVMHIFAHHQIFTWHPWTHEGCISKRSKSENVWNHQSSHSLNNRTHSATVPDYPIVQNGFIGQTLITCPQKI